MEEKNGFFDKFFNFLPGYIFGLLGFTIAFLGIIIALVTSPEYIIWRSSISVLGSHRLNLKIAISIDSVILTF